MNDWFDTHIARLGCIPMVTLMLLILLLFSAAIGFAVYGLCTLFLSTDLAWHVGVLAGVLTLIWHLTDMFVKIIYRLRKDT